MYYSLYLKIKSSLPSKEKTLNFLAEAKKVLRPFWAYTLEKAPEIIITAIFKGIGAGFTKGATTVVDAHIRKHFNPKP